MDECEENPCSGECQNTIGSYLCVFEKQEKPNIDSTAQDKGQSCQPGFYWNEGTKNCLGMKNIVDFEEKRIYYIFFWKCNIFFESD